MKTRALKFLREIFGYEKAPSAGYRAQYNEKHIHILIEIVPNMNDICL